MSDILSNSEIFQLAQTGAVGVMLVATWKLMISKDKKIYELINEQEENKEKLYQYLNDIIKEVTAALVSKNLSDEQLAKCMESLIEQLSIIKSMLKDKE